jgi:hypothetical protein
MRPDERIVTISERAGGWLRNHPVALAGIASAIGVASGALLFVVMFLGGPVSHDEASPAGAARTITSRAETTGSAMQAEKLEPAATNVAPVEPSSQKSAEEKPAAADCQEQTWPYIARSCLAGEESNKRGVRVISTDKLPEPVIGALETPPPSVTNRVVRTETPHALPPPPAEVAAPEPAPPVNNQIAAAPLPPAPEVEAKIEPAIAITSPSAPRQEPVPRQVMVPDEQPRAAARQAAVADEQARVTQPKPAPARKSKPAKRQYQTDDAVALQDGNSGRARIVERWTEREYNVQSEDGEPQRRRVIVIRRGGGEERGDDDGFDRYRPSVSFSRPSLWD